MLLLDHSAPTNIFAPAATPAHEIFRLSILTLSITGTIFLVVGGLRIQDRNVGR